MWKLPSETNTIIRDTVLLEICNESIEDDTYKHTIPVSLARLKSKVHPSRLEKQQRNLA